MVSSITQIQGKMLQQLEKIFIEYSMDMTKNYFEFYPLKCYNNTGGEMKWVQRYK